MEKELEDHQFDYVQNDIYSQDCFGHLSNHTHSSLTKPTVCPTLFKNHPQNV